MTAGELIKELKKYPKDSPVLYCTDWDATDEQGYLTALQELDEVCDQFVIIDDGLDFTEEHQLILTFKKG